MTDDDHLHALLDAAREGDDRAVGEFVRLTQPDVWRLCVAIGSRDDAEDLVQESYLRALGALDRYRGEAPVRIWLLSIARRTCADHVRRRQRERRLWSRLTAAATRDTPPATDHTDVLLDTLDLDRREAFVLTQVMGLSYDDAAAVIGCPIGTIRSRVARARADLQAAQRRSDSA
jgi:RNA polymerase sigma-70 factor (ECF subfamily)